MKKIVFFDGDGTLWYPRATRRKKAPWWVYSDPRTAVKPHRHLILTPTAAATLRKLGARNIIRVILSTHPHPPREADEILRAKVRHFRLSDLVDEIHATRAYHASKAEHILEVLARMKLPKKSALMVGDVYDWDYKPARSIGVDAVLIESAYDAVPNAGRVRRKIRQLKDIFRYI